MLEALAERGEEGLAALIGDQLPPESRAFTVKVFKGGTLVAKATKSLGASPDPRFVAVPTVSAGKSLAHNDVVTVKVKTSTGTTSTDVTLL